MFFLFHFFSPVFVWSYARTERKAFRVCVCVCVCVSRCDRNIVMFVTVRAFWAYMGLYGHRLDVERAVFGLEEHEVREVHLHVCVEAHFVRDGCCKVAPDDAVVHAVRRLS